MNVIEVDMENVSVKASVTRESTENSSSNQDTDAVSSSSEGQITMDEVINMVCYNFSTKYA